MNIDTIKIQDELQALADYVPTKEGQSTKPRRNCMKVKVKLCKSQDIAMSSRETDEGVTVIFNPKKYRTDTKLNDHLNNLRRDLTWGS